MTTLLKQSDNYMTHTHRGGGASITRKSDNRSVFFQAGDDASEWLNQIEAIEQEWPAHKQDYIFDICCGDYDHLIDG